MGVGASKDDSARSRAAVSCVHRSSKAPTNLHRAPGAGDTATGRCLGGSTRPYRAQIGVYRKPICALALVRRSSLPATIARLPSLYMRQRRARRDCFLHALRRITASLRRCQYKCNTNIESDRRLRRIWYGPGMSLLPTERASVNLASTMKPVVACAKRQGGAWI